MSAQGWWWLEDALVLALAPGIEGNRWRDSLRAIGTIERMNE